MAGKASEFVKVNGKVSFSIEELLSITGKRKLKDAYGEEVTLVLTGPIAGLIERPTASAGLQETVTITGKDGLLLSKEDASEFLETMAKRAAKRYEEQTGQKPLDLDKASEDKTTAKGQARGKDSRDT